MKKLIPADTVDAKGNVWKTTGENIRNGAKEFSEDDIKSIVDIMFPVGSVFIGENSIIFSVGTWESIDKPIGTMLVLASGIISGYQTNIAVYGDTEKPAVVVRLWRRVS